MTVAELKKKLELVDPDARVALNGTEMTWAESRVQIISRNFDRKPLILAITPKMTQDDSPLDVLAETGECFIAEV